MDVIQQLNLNAQIAKVFTPSFPIKNDVLTAP